MVSRRSNLIATSTHDPLFPAQCDERFCYDIDLRKNVASVHNKTECDECGMLVTQENFNMHKYWAHRGKLRADKKTKYDDGTGISKCNRQTEHGGKDDGEIEAGHKDEELIE